MLGGVRLRDGQPFYRAPGVMAATKPPAPLPWWASFACGGLAACIAEVVTLPIDTAKVRLQLLKKAAGATAAGGATAAAGTPLPAQNIGMIRMVGKIAAEEGPIALYKGFWPAIHRQLVFASLRIGLYGQVGVACMGRAGCARLCLRIACQLLVACPTCLHARAGGAGGVAADQRHVPEAGRDDGVAAAQDPGWPGCRRYRHQRRECERVTGTRRRLVHALPTAVAVTGRRLMRPRSIAVLPLCVRAFLQPTDLVKVRFQSEGRLAPGQKSRYSGVMNAYATIVKQEGLGGLWTGLGPSIARNSIINATELASYETAKEVRRAGGSCTTQTPGVSVGTHPPTI